MSNYQSGVGFNASFATVCFSRSNSFEAYYQNCIRLFIEKLSCMKNNCPWYIAGFELPSLQNN